MPIRPENRARYPKDWKAIRERILARAGNRCEGSPAYPDCRAINGRLSARRRADHRAPQPHAGGQSRREPSRLVPEVPFDLRREAPCPERGPDAARPKGDRRSAMRATPPPPSLTSGEIEELDHIAALCDIALQDAVTERSDETGERYSVYDGRSFANALAGNGYRVLKLSGGSAAQVPPPIASTAGWLPISTAPKDMTPIWAALHPDIFPRLCPDRPDLVRWNGIQVPLRHPGVYENGGRTWDHGWNVAAPVGNGGFPDEWIAGWQPLPPAPSQEGASEGEGET